MLFFLELSHIIEKKERYKIAFIPLWFAIIFTSIAAIFSYLLKTMPSSQTPADWGGILFVSIIILGLICLSALSWLIVFALIFGNRNTNKAKIEVVKTALWGIELVREELSPFHVIKSEQSPEIDKSMAWSWIAFDNRQGVDSTGAIALIEAAIWNLVSLKIVEPKIRHEKISYLFNKIKVYDGEEIYFTFISKSNDIPVGVWERRLYHAIKNSSEKNQTMKTFDWVIMAFGNSSGNPMSKALEYTEDEFIEKKWGQRTGKFMRKFEWKADPTRSSLWSVIKSYIDSHEDREDLGLQLRKKIELGLKNRADT